MTLLLIFSLNGCVKEPVKKTPVRIGIDLWIGYAYAFIAQEKRLFIKNGVDVELVLKNSTIESPDSYSSGETQGMFGLFSDMIMLNANGIPTKTVYIVDHSVTGDAIMSRADIRSLKELKGKRVSFEGINTFSHIFVLKALEGAGIKESEVRLRVVSGVDLPKALEQNEIDAGHTWEPLKSGALRKGYIPLAESKDVPGIITDCLMFSPTMIQSRPDDIRRIIKALLEAKDFLYSNQDEAVAIMAKALQMPKSDVASGLNGAFRYGLDDNLKALRKAEGGWSLYTSYKIITDFYLQRGQITNLPVFEELIEPKFVMKLWEEKKGKD